MKRIILCAVIISVMLLAAGCGRQPVTMPTADGDTGTAQNVDSAGDGVSSTTPAKGGKLTTQLGAEEIWSEELALNGQRVTSAKISASVSVPDTDHMCVLTMRADIFSGEKKKALLEAACDTGSIYVFDEEAWPEWFAELEINRMEMEVASQLRMKKEFPNNFDEELFHVMQENLKEYKEKGEKAVAQGRVSEDYQEEQYYGMRDGKNLMFYFREGYAAWNIEGGLQDLTVKEGISDVERFSYSIQKHPLSENLCSMSEEQAVRAAEDYVKNIGYSGYGVYATSALDWTIYDDNGEGAESWVDGYSVTFTREVDGILQDVGEFLLYDGDYRVTDSRYGLEYISLSINDSGILDCHIHYPYFVEEVSASATTLLSYEQVQEIFREILQKEPDKLSSYGSQLNFNSMDLIYFRVADAKGETYALLPVWVLSNKDNSMERTYYQCALMVNAIDGSRINYMEELNVLEQQK